MSWLLRLALLGSLLTAQETTVFKTGVSLVHVDVEVTGAGQLLSGFHKEDFRIFDNGAEQPILYFSHGETPLDLILLFDISGSMQPKLEKLAVSAHAALAQLRPGDRVAVMVFSTNTTLVEPFTGDMRAVEETINERVLGKASGGTHILRAVKDAADYFLKEPRSDRRRAVLIVTDNHGQPSGHKSAVVRELWEADAMLSGLELRNAGEGALLVSRWALSPETAWMQMESMTGVVDKTGGDLMKGRDPAADFEEMIRRIRLRYTLLYALPKGKPGEERRIKVELSDAARKTNPQALIHARYGYDFPK